MDIKILSCFHKEFEMPNTDVIKPIHVGKALSDIELDILRDDIGDNISNKNKNYCELTAIYWAWKNIKCDIIGLTHYRRYFDFRGNKFKYNPVNIEDTTILKDELFTIYSKNISNIFNQGYDIILPKKNNYPMSIKKQYIMGHLKEDIDILESVLNRLYPDYIDSYNKVFNKSNSIHLYNMFIMKKDDFDQYCEWLFNILKELEIEIKISEYPYQQRVFGFIAERLLNVYIVHNNFKIKEKPIIFIDNSNKSINFIKLQLIKLRNNIKFRI